MYQIGTYIVYGNCGVCRVADIGPRSFSGSDDSRLYYTLEPVFDTGAIYIPVDTNAFMRPTLDREEAERLIDRIPSIPGGTVDAQNVHLLAEYYQASFRSHECTELVHLIKTIHERGSHAERFGKKPSSIDQRYLKRAEELLHGELSVALGIPREEVADYIRQRLEPQQHKSTASSYTVKRTEA